MSIREDGLEVEAIPREGQHEPAQTLGGERLQGSRRPGVGPREFEFHVACVFSWCLACNSGQHCRWVCALRWTVGPFPLGFSWDLLAPFPVCLQ